jgi:DNA-3-methyladenine glycosylase
MEREFFARPVVDVARDLLGCTLRHGETAGVIVETEAYHDSEPACHAHVGLTTRTRTLFGRPGTAYVYFSYGIHALFNAVCEPEGTGAAVLVRALEPTMGVDRMRDRRGVRRAEDLCSGPGKLTQALGIELDHNATSLTGGGPIELLPRTERSRVATGTRIGITKAADLPWRFALHGNPHVSRPRPWVA